VLAIHAGLVSDARSHPIFTSTSRISQPRAGAGGILYAGAVALWGGGSVLLLGWLLVSQIFVERLRRSGVLVRDGIAALTLASVCRSMRVRPPLLLASNRVQSPFLTGIWRPAVLLPAGHETEFDEPAIRAILIHELTHLVRRDCTWRLLARLMSAVLWPQPLLWLLTRRLAQVGEELCDEAVLQEQVSPHLYAACLLRLAERLVPPWPERAAGLGVVPFRSSLGQRIEQILDGSRRRTLSLSTSLRIAVGLGAAGAVVAGLSLVSAAAPRLSRAGQPMKRLEKLRGGPFSGRVVTPDGKPVPGATVSWIGRIDETPTLIASVKTDAAGQFRFADTTPFRRKDDYPQLLVEAEGWGLTFPMLQENLHTMEISINPATELSVRFVDPEGKPVADRKVSPTILGGENRSYLWVSPALGLRFAQSTDVNGVVTFRSLPRNYRLGLAIADERFARLSPRNEIHLSSAALTRAEPIRLQPGAVISGRITIGPGGKPVAGIKVGAQGMGPGEGWGDAVSSADGEYRITQLPPGAYNVAVSLKDAVARSWTARAHEGVYVQEGEHRDGIDFALIAGAVIRGRVVAEDNGEPIPDVSIGVYGPAHPESGAWVQGTQTGPDGAYLHRVPEGKQHLYISMATPPPGFLMPANRSRDLTVRDGETVTVDFKLPRGARIKPVRGRVVGPDGSAVAGAEVVLFSAEPGGGSSLQTDADGVFTVSQRYLSQTVTLRARRGDLATPTGSIVAPGQEVTLRLQRNALVSLSGRVTGAADRPIAGAPITLIAWAYDSGGGSVAAQTDSEGRYRLADLWPDLRYSVEATAKGFGRKYTEKVQLQPGESRELSPLVLQVADRTVPVEWWTNEASR